MKNETTGTVKVSYLGYSWTMLLFNWFAPLCRGDFLTFGIMLAFHIAIISNTPLVIAFYCLGFPSFIWSFFWNKHYTQKLIKKGYVFADSEIRNQWAQCELGKKETTKKLVLIFLTIILILPVLVFESRMRDFGASLEENISSTLPSTSSNSQSSKGLVAENTISKNIYPTGELADIFNVGSDYTNLQRETKLAEIKGKTVEWSLPVYEIAKVGDKYKITIIDSGYVSCYIYITVKDPSDISILLATKTGDSINIRGTFKGETSMRSLVLDGVLIPSQGYNPSTSNAQEPSYSPPLDGVTRQLTTIAGAFDCGIGSDPTCTMDNVAQNTPKLVHFAGEQITKLFTGCKYNDLCIVTTKIDKYDNAIDIRSVRPFISLDKEVHTKNVQFLECKSYEGGYYYIFLADESNIRIGLFLGASEAKYFCPKLVKNKRYSMKYFAEKIENVEGDTELNLSIVEIQAN